MFEITWKRVNTFLIFLSVAFGAKFGEDLLRRYMSLPFPSLVLTFVGITTALAIPAAVFLFWPKDGRYGATYKTLLRKFYDYLWSFIVAGLGTEFIVLANNMAPFYMLWGTWVVFGLWGLLLFDVWLMREPLNIRLVNEWVFKRFGVQSPNQH